MTRSDKRIRIAVGLSLLAHAALIAFAPHRPPTPLRLSAREGPMIVTLEEVQPQPVPPPPEPAPPQPAPKATPAAPARPLITARPRTPQAAPPVPAPEAPRPAPAPPAPTVDMLAMINARRERRRAAEAAAARGSEGVPGGQISPQDEGAAAIGRNLESLSRDDQTGGVFQILSKGTLSAEYAFNGWRPDTRRRWREVIDVQAGPDGDIDSAIVRSMIALIRTHYTGDFQWESRRLGRVVTLSARAEDNEALEDFLVREFFGTPVLNPGRR